MRLRDLFNFGGRPRRDGLPLVTDWTRTWTPRDWADMPSPRRQSRVGHDR